MDIKDVGQTVAKFAPLLGGALAGPGGAAIGSIIASVFGGDVKKPEELRKIIIKDPQAAVKLKRIETEHHKDLQCLVMQAAQEDAKNELSDRANARAREAAVDNASGVARDKTPATLAYMLTIGVFAALASLFYFPVPHANQEMIVGIIASLTTVWVGAMGYYHGSSSGSRLKDLSLFKQLHKTT